MHTEIVQGRHFEIRVTYDESDSIVYKFFTYYVGRKEPELVSYCFQSWTGQMDLHATPNDTLPEVLEEIYH